MSRRLFRNGYGFSTRNSSKSMKDSYRNTKKVVTLCKAWLVNWYSGKKRNLGWSTRGTPWSRSIISLKNWEKESSKCSKVATIWTLKHKFQSIRLKRSKTAKMQFRLSFKKAMRKKFKSIIPAFFLRLNRKVDSLILKRCILVFTFSNKLKSNTKFRAPPCSPSTKKQKTFTDRVFSTISTFGKLSSGSASRDTTTKVFSKIFQKRAIEWTSTNGWFFVKNSISLKNCPKKT